jgi:hypothetical protein
MLVLPFIILENAGSEGRSHREILNMFYSLVLCCDSLAPVALRVSQTTALVDPWGQMKDL